MFDKPTEFFKTDSSNLIRRKINVLYVIDNLLIGGAQELVKTLALNLDRERFKVSVCSLNNYPEKLHSEPLAQEIENNGIKVLTLYMKSFNDYEEKRKFVDILRTEKIDIMHAHLRPTDLWSTLIAKEAGVAVAIHTKHETYHDRPITWRLKEAIVYNRYTDCAIAISKATRRHMIGYEFINPFKVKIIHNPVDATKFSPNVSLAKKTRETLGISDRMPVIGNIARFVPRKGVEYFLKTCAMVKKEIPNSKFLLVGWGEDEVKYRKMVEELGLRDSFLFAVAKRNIQELLSAMDIFLFTPLWGESLPIVILEAMSAGKAVVATNIISNPELIVDRVSGLLPTPKRWVMSVKSLDAKVLAGAVIKLVKDPALQKKLGEEARMRVLNCFSTDVIIRKFEALYIELLIEKLGRTKAKKRGLI